VRSPQAIPQGCKSHPGRRDRPAPAAVAGQSARPRAAGTCPKTLPLAAAGRLMIVEGDAAGLLLVGGRRRSTPRDRPTRNCVGGEGTRVDRVHPPADGSIASYVDG